MRIMNIKISIHFFLVKYVVEERILIKALVQFNIFFLKIHYDFLLLFTAPYNSTILVMLTIMS